MPRMTKKDITISFKIPNLHIQQYMVHFDMFILFSELVINILYRT